MAERATSGSNLSSAQAGRRGVHILTKQEERLNRLIDNEVQMLESDQEKGAYLEAVQTAPSVVATESAPFLFQDKDIPGSARALAAYWRMRMDAFGHDRAFRPLLTPTEPRITSSHSPLVSEQGFVFRALPPDTEGCPVVMVEARRDAQLASRKTDWREVSRALFRSLAHAAARSLENDLKLDVVVLFVMVGFNKDVMNGTKTLAKMVLDMIQDALPLKIKKFHVLCNPVDSNARDLFFYSFVPAVLPACLVQGGNELCMLHVRDQISGFLARLEPFGLIAEGLPSFLGGHMDGGESDCDRGARAQKEDAKRLQFLSSASSWPNSTPSKEAINTDPDDVSTNVSSISKDSMRKIATTRSSVLSSDKASCTPGDEEMQSKPRTKDFYRTRNAMYSRRKYMRKKIELNVLQEQCSNLRASNDQLRDEEARLTELIAQAHRMIELFDMLEGQEGSQSYGCE